MQQQIEGVAWNSKISLCMVVKQATHMHSI